jgi:branched-subunit amino acid transport protein
VAGPERILPAWMKQTLHNVLPAVLGSLVALGVVTTHGSIDTSQLVPRLLAATVAILIAWRFHSLLATMAAGMLSLWVLLTIF